jgi:hypothetical protein
MTRLYGTWERPLSLLERKSNGVPFRGETIIFFCTTTTMQDETFMLIRLTTLGKDLTSTGVTAYQYLMMR